MKRVIDWGVGKMSRAWQVVVKLQQTSANHVVVLKDGNIGRVWCDVKEEREKWGEKGNI